MIVEYFLELKFLGECGDFLEGGCRFLESFFNGCVEKGEGGGGCS